METIWLQKYWKVLCGTRRIPSTAVYILVGPIRVLRLANVKNNLEQGTQAS